MDEAALLEMRFFLMLLLRTPCSIREQSFGDPVSGLTELMVSRGKSLDEVIEYCDGEEIRLSGCIKLRLNTKYRSIIVVGDSNNTYGEYLDKVKANAKSRRIKIII